MSADALGEILKAQPEGKVMWISVRGRSMRPVLTGGESLKVKRCSASAVKRGEIAVMLRADGVLISHLVVGTGPVRTESFDGKPDADGLEVLGRAIAVRRGALVMPLPRLPLLVLQRVWRLATRSAISQAAYGTAGAVVASPHTSGLRTLLGKIEIDVLGPEALKEFAIALSRYETLSATHLETLLRDGVVVGARRRGRLVGCVAIGTDKVLSHAFIQRRAQGLGLEAVMIDRVIREATARQLDPAGAAVDASQPGFIAAAQGIGLC